MTDEIRNAARGVALVWRDDRRDGNDQAITEELRGNLDRLVTAFERRAGGHLEDLAIHRAAEYLAEAGELPGMWEASDLYGGWADTDSQSRDERTPHP